MNEESMIQKALTDTVLTRRSFLKWSAALGGTAALAGGMNLGLKTVEAAVQNAAETDGKWVTVACWHNCGGRCLLKAHVVDGVVTRVKSDDTHPDSPNFPVQRACVRGRSQRMQVFGADRLKYPMKRKNWAPGGGKKELRGKDEWVRISWDEALDIFATETKRILDEHGNKSIYATSYGDAFGALYYDPMSRIFSVLGGNVGAWGTVSWGAWPAPSIHMMGGFPNTNDRLDLQNSKLIVLWGANPAWSRQGNTTSFYMEAKRAGARIICVDPMYSATAKTLADEWIPCRPGTDTALLLAIAYHMIENNLQDQAFLDTYAVGFDRDHMPEGADPKENFKDYVLGKYDGTPKSPEWASEICGTHPGVIRSLAQQIATTKPAAFISSYAPARTNRGEQYAQAFFTVGWMTGNVGIPGGVVTWDPLPGGPPLVKLGPRGTSYKDNPVFPSKYLFPFPDPADETWTGLNWSEQWDAILNGEYTAGVRGKQPIDIRMIYHGHSAMLNQSPSLNKGIEAHRKVEFVVSASQFLTTNSKYADLVFPVTTYWERVGDLISANRESIFWWQQASQPLFEAKSDLDIALALAEKMGIDIEMIPFEQVIFNQVAGAEVIKPDGSGFEKLVTITTDDIKEWGVEGEPQKGRIALKEFQEQGVYQVERKPGDRFTHIQLKAFRDDPVANPVGTPSGKLQIHSANLAGHIAAFGWDEIAPIAKYEPPVEGYEGTLDGKYPLQLWTPHYLRRSHSVFDNVTWLREAFPQEVWMNPMDAKARGIEQGDTIKITTKHGTALRHVKVDAGIMPGTIATGEGAWADRDDNTGIDMAGATNSLCGPVPTGQGVQGWNTTNAQVEIWTGKSIGADYKQPQRIIFGEEA